MEFKFIIYFGIFFGYLKFSESIDCTFKDHKTTELRLKHDLLCEYDSDERPNTKNGTLVKIRLFLKKFDYLEHTGQIEILSWLGMVWMDDRLKWNLGDYDNIDDLVIEGDSVWMPDLSIYNSDKTQFHENCEKTACHVNNYGEVTCMPPCQHTAECDTNYANWPFDEQKCSLNLGSWLHKGTELRFKEANTIIDIEDITHNEWKLLNVTYKNNAGIFKCCPNQTFPSVTYTINIQRHSEIFMISIIAPAMILCFINLSTLWLSPNCPERLILILLSIYLHFYYMQSVFWLAPKGGAIVPVAVIFFRDSLIIIAVILLQTIIMQCLLLCEKSSPEWIKSTAQSLRSHKMGQLMFENPYIINRTPLDNESTVIDSADLLENAQNNENIINTTEKQVWFSAVKMIDTLLFIILIICYLIMICGWLPSSKIKSIDNKNIEIQSSDYTREVTINSWLSMKWHDDRLKWNSKDYDNLNELIVKSEDIWMPSLSLYNSDTTQFHETCSSAHCTISNSGNIGCIPPCVHSVECDTNFANWPYDIQNCTLHFGSWMNKGKEISFIEQRTVIDRSKLKHNQFNIIKITAKNIPGSYSCCPNDTFPSVKYNILIERHSGTETCYIAAPAIILAFLNLSTLWFNPICIERLLIIIVSLISHFEYISHLNWVLPNNGSVVPLVLLYFKDSLIFAAVLLLETLLMRGLIHCQKSSPVWIKSAAESLRGNRVGQIMFENPYIINKSTLDGNGDDVANLVEGQNQEPVTVAGSNKLAEKQVWFSTVKIIDTILFFILLICYIVMLCRWLPNSKLIPIDEKSVDIRNDTSTI